MKLILFSLPMTVSSLAVAQTSTIVQIEYFVDADKGTAKGTLLNVTPTADGSFTFNINAASFSGGFHKLYIRTKDNNGNWSLTARRTIEVPGPQLKTTITGGEYFVDADPGFGKGQTINITSPDSIISQNLIANLSSLTPGYHKLYIRTKDNNGNWSLTSRRNIEVVGPQLKTTITSGEYFIDTDPGFNKGMPIAITSPDSVILQQFAAVTSGLTEGFHKLYGRLKDNNDNWSLTFRRNIEVYNDINSNINNAEYFFKTDKGFGSASPVIFSSPAADGTFSFNIPLNEIPSGADTLFIRVQGSGNNRWSLTQWQDVSAVLPLTLLSFNVVKINNTAQLKWQTASEINTAYFNIQRSADGSNFKTIGQVPAKGYSSGKTDYVYTDDLIKLSPGKLYYRLQMTDLDGSATFSPVRYINIDLEAFSIIVTPNPVVSQKINLNIYSPGEANLKLTLYTMSGKTCFSEQFQVNAGNTDTKFDVSHLEAGIYLLRISNGVNVKTFKIVKQ